MSFMPDYFMPDYSKRWPSPLVVELADAFGHYHLAMSVLVPNAACGKRGQVTRLLGFSSWNGSAGPMPATFCGRCAKASGIASRSLQLEVFQKVVTARTARRTAMETLLARGVIDAVGALSGLADQDCGGDRTLRSIGEDFESREVAGTGWVDLPAEIEQARQNRGGCCTDWMPADSLLYARVGV